MHGDVKLVATSVTIKVQPVPRWQLDMASAAMLVIEHSAQGVACAACGAREQAIAERRNDQHTTQSKVVCVMFASILTDSCELIFAVLMPGREARVDGAQVARELGDGLLRVANVLLDPAVLEIAARVESAAATS